MTIKPSKWYIIIISTKIFTRYYIIIVSIAFLLGYALNYIKFIPTIILSTAILLIISILYSFLFIYYYHVKLQSDCLSKSYGVVIKKTTTIPYRAIQNIDSRRGIIHRILDLTDLSIQTAGMSTSTPPLWFTPRTISEGILPGFRSETAERVRSEILRLAADPGLSTQKLSI